MYKTEQITDNSYLDIQKLYELSFGLYESLDLIKKKYNTNVFGLKNIGFIAKNEEEELAAYYGVFPIVLSYNSKDYLIAQSGDTMTAPNHRKKGLFTTLAKETYSLSKEKGIKLIFGFPNENSYPGFERKLNWEFSGFMEKFTFKVKAIPFCELASKYSILSSLYASFVKKKIRRYQVNLGEVNYKSFNHSEVKGQIKKDQNFFEYKLSRDNTYVVSINGIQLLLKAEKHLYIGEVSKIAPLQVELLIESVKKLAQRLACYKVVFTLSKNHWLFNILASQEESTKSLPIGFYAMDNSFDLNEFQFSGADYDTF